MNFFSNNYDIFRALHLMAVIAWMAGLMYLPRLFVYHSKAEIGSELDKTLTIMERKLFKYIMQPSFIVVWALGICLILANGVGIFKLGWFHVKLGMVVLISIIHFLYGFWQKDFENSKRPLSHVFFRFINEAPFLLMMVAVYFVITKPNF